MLGDQKPLILPRHAYRVWGGVNHCLSVLTNCIIGMMQGSNFSSHTRKMRIKKAISEVVFSLLAFSREWKFGAVIRGS